MSEDLTEQELRDLHLKLSALSDEDVLDQIVSLSKLYDLQLEKNDLSEDFLDYHSFWTDILAEESAKRGL
jgi:hypothetical protein